MAAKKITIAVQAILELDPADFGWIDALDPDELKHSIYELLEYTSPVELSYWRKTIRGTVSFVLPAPQQLKAASDAAGRKG